MPSRIIARIALTDIDFSKDIDYLNHIAKPDVEYDEFGQGFRTNPTLINGTGNSKDTLFRDGERAMETEHARRVPAIMRVIEDVFDRTHLRMVRARNLVDGLIMPHRDYLEVGKTVDYYRIFVPIEYNQYAYHSDESGVFHMKPGEVWFLDAAIVHSAANFSSRSRWFLCLDFFLSPNSNLAVIFKNSPRMFWDVDHAYIRRQPLSAERRAEIVAAVAVLLEEETIKDVAHSLSKLHFRYEIPIAACYDMLSEAAARLGNPRINNAVAAMIDFLIEHRTIGQRFCFGDYAVARGLNRPLPVGSRTHASTSLAGARRCASG